MKTLTGILVGMGIMGLCFGLEHLKPQEKFVVGEYNKAGHYYVLVNKQYFEKKEFSISSEEGIMRQNKPKESYNQ